MTGYLSLRQILALHALQIARFGGSAGLRDRASLEAAVARPRATFAGEDLHAGLPAKATALFHAIAQGHLFVDGNERTGAHGAILFLLVNGHETDFTASELTAATLAAARGEIPAEALAIWLRQRTHRSDG